MEIILILAFIAVLIWGGMLLMRSSKGPSTTNDPNRSINTSSQSSTSSGGSISPERRTEAHVVLRVEQNAMEYAEKNVTKFLTGDFDGMNAGDCTAVRIALHLAKGDKAGAKKILTGSIVGQFVKTGRYETSLTPENYPDFTHADSLKKYLLPYFDKNT